MHELKRRPCDCSTQQVPNHLDRRRSIYRMCGCPPVPACHLCISKVPRSASRKAMTSRLQHECRNPRNQTIVFSSVRIVSLAICLIAPELVKAAGCCAVTDKLLSCSCPEDQTTINMARKGIHKLQQGSWEILMRSRGPS